MISIFIFYQNIQYQNLSIRIIFSFLQAFYTIMEHYLGSVFIQLSLVGQVLIELILIFILSNLLRYLSAVRSLVLLSNLLKSFEYFEYSIFLLTTFEHLFRLTIAVAKLLDILLSCCYNPATSFYSLYVASKFIFICLIYYLLNKNKVDQFYLTKYERLVANLLLFQVRFLFFEVTKEFINDLFVLLEAFVLNLELAVFFSYLRKVLNSRYL